MNWIQLWTLGTSKLSVIFFYRSIFVSRAFRVLSVAMICAVMIWMVGGFLGVAFQCGSHITLLWTSAASTKLYCRTGESVAFGFSIPDVVLDIFILCMPIYWTTRLHMSPRKRIAVCAIFLFGAITVIASIVRLIIYVKLYPKIKQNPDQIGVQTTIVYWSMLEIGLSILAACLPTFWPLIARRPTPKIGYYLRTLLPRRLNDSEKSTAADRNANPLFVPNNAVKQYCKIEGNTASIPERKSTETMEHITVTTGISRHESVEQMVWESGGDLCNILLHDNHDEYLRRKFVHDNLLEVVRKSSLFTCRCFERSCNQFPMESHQDTCALMLYDSLLPESAFKLFMDGVN